jgi:hypothetical protein
MAIFLAPLTSRSIIPLQSLHCNSPPHFSECPNNPELCVFDYASESDKDSICNDPYFAVNSTGPYPYSRKAGRFRVDNTAAINPNPIVLAVRKDFKGDRNRLV